MLARPREDTPLPIVSFITDFADQAVMLPLAATIPAMLAWAGWRRGALAWLLAVACAWTAMLALKLLGVHCGRLLFGPALTSPSGHVSSAAVVYGALAALALGRAGARLGHALPCAAAVAVVVGASRLALGVHTPAEVALGGLVGVGGAWLFARAAGPRPPGARLRRAGVAAALVVLLTHGFHLPAEAAITNAAANVWPLSLCIRAPS